MKSLLFITLLFIGLNDLAAQVSINTDNSTPNPSAMLDVKSTDKGILIPRMTTAQRTAVANPATGLLVFDNDTGSFWFYNGTVWEKLGDKNYSILSDGSSGHIQLTDGSNFSTLTLNVDDADADATNELQDVLHNGSPGHVMIANSNYSSEVYIDVDDADANPSNEIQDLNLTNDILTITNNPSAADIDLSSYVNSTPPFSSDLLNASTSGDLDFSCANIADSRSITGLTRVQLTDDKSTLLTLEGNKLTVYDLSTPANPVQIGSLSSFSGVKDMKVQGNYVYLLTNQLIAVDISTPSAPTLAGIQNLGSGTIALAISGNYAAVAKGPLPDQLLIIDISNPSFMGTVGNLNIATDSDDDIEMYGDGVYVADRFADKLEVVSIADPYNPIVVNTIDTYYPVKLEVFEDKLYVVGGTIETQKYDVSVPTSPSFMSTIDDPAPLQFDINGGYLNMLTQTDAREFTYYLYDLSGVSSSFINLDNFEEVAIPYATTSSAHIVGEVVATDRYAYFLNNHHNTLEIIELTCTEGVFMGYDAVNGEIIPMESGFIPLTEAEVDAYVSNNGYLITEVDGDPTNELQDVLHNGSPGHVMVANGNHSSEVYINVNDADADPTNELNTTVVLNGTSLDITDGGGTISADLSSLQDTDWATGANTVYNLNDKIGIGEMTPQASLDVVDQAVIGNLNVGTQSTDQGASNAAGKGFTVTPWLYTNALEAQGERGAASTLITLGADGTYGVADEIHFITSGNSQLQIDAAGKIGIDKDPNTDIHIRQSQNNITNGTGGIKYEHSDNVNEYWRTYHGGTYFSFNLQGNRVAYVNTNGAWTVNSDRRLKKNVVNMPSTLSRVLQMRPVSYHYNKQKDNADRSLGFIAQEVQPLFPEMVTEGEDGYLGMSYSYAGVIAIKAVQEQQDIIQAQEQEIQALKTQLQAQETAFEQRLQRLEATLKK